MLLLKNPKFYLDAFRRHVNFFFIKFTFSNLESKRIKNIKTGYGIESANLEVVLLISWILNLENHLQIQIQPTPALQESALNTFIRELQIAQVLFPSDYSRLFNKQKLPLADNKIPLFNFVDLYIK